MEFGGILHDREKVLDIQPGSVVNIKTIKNTYKARSVVITVGKKLCVELYVKSYSSFCCNIHRFLGLIIRYYIFSLLLLLLKINSFIH